MVKSWAMHHGIINSLVTVGMVFAQYFPTSRADFMPYPGHPSSHGIENTPVQASSHREYPESPADITLMA